MKGKSAIHIARMYGGKRRTLWGSTFGRGAIGYRRWAQDEAAVRRYIQEQEKEDQRLDQLGLYGQAALSGSRTLTRFERFTISSLRLCRRSLTMFHVNAICARMYNPLNS